MKLRLILEAEPVDQCGQHYERDIIVEADEKTRIALIGLLNLSSREGQLVVLDVLVEKEEVQKESHQ